MQPTGIYAFGNAWCSLAFGAAETRVLDVFLQMFCFQGVGQFCDQRQSVREQLTGASLSYPFPLGIPLRMGMGNSLCLLQKATKVTKKIIHGRPAPCGGWKQPHIGEIP